MGLVWWVLLIGSTQGKPYSSKHRIQDIPLRGYIDNFLCVFGISKRLLRLQNLVKKAAQPCSKEKFEKRYGIFENTLGYLKFSGLVHQFDAFYESFPLLLRDGEGILHL